MRACWTTINPGRRSFNKIIGILGSFIDWLSLSQDRAGDNLEGGSMDTRLVVTVDPSDIGRIKKVARELGRAGMSVDQVLATTGIITGSAPDALRPLLARIPGVTAVDLDSVDTAPPDGDTA
jgi:hypothetical protein